ncbi:scm-like with four MBT domains protein 2 isoform X2 [Rhineura floridana]|uniref:scm-like with four MBT domains protein 2 isoform X2 n=1 Tax=Rhineura floridana TaxID=261503 RepID=UPI002AC87308|nr:scm-like with four MBT domains protein 2 isoform X2 [Rhineura floridana]
MAGEKKRKIVPYAELGERESFLCVMETRQSVIFSMQKTQCHSVEENPSPANGNAEQVDSDESSNSEDVDFNWDEYLEETGSTAAPHTSFKHVEVSLQSSFQPGMKLEVANKHNSDTYWVATIITTCGQLLLLRYCGYEDDRKADFWCDVMTADLHPVGWCTQNNKVLMPPNAIKEKYADWTEFLIRDLTGSRTAPANLLEGPLRGKNPVDLITVDSLIELQDSQSPFQYWIVSVLENIGGRLRLRYVGLEETESYDQWLFYLDYRLRPVGWCQENKYRLDPPAEIYSLKTVSEWQSALDNSLDEAARFPLPMEVFKDHDDLRNHLFTVGMKLEAVDVREPCNICPATVSKVFNNHFVQVTIDDLRPEMSTTSELCHADSLGIMPVQWCLKNGVHLTPPKGYSSQDFDWADYQKQCGTEAAPQFCFRNVSFSRGFTKNMKLEAVNPKNRAEICVASVISVKGKLMWLQLEGLQVPASEYIVDVESMDIFPVGWCEANAYKLSAPRKALIQRKRKIAVVQPEKQLPPGVPVEKIIHEPCIIPQAETIGAINGRYSCPPLFINHRCFSGPHLNKGRLAELPQSVGPGKCVLVLKEVLSMVINSAYKPGSVLRELQLVEDPRWNFQEETLKAKYRGKTYRATVKIVRTSDQVLDFCRRVCTKLECCPNLFSPVPVTEACPENCSIHTKTKYTYYYGKRRKVMKSPFGDNSPESRHRKPARRRKRRKPILAQKKKQSSARDAAESAEESDEEEPEALDYETWSEETSPELHDDQTDVSSAEVPPAKPTSAMKLRSRAAADCATHAGRGSQAQKTLSLLCAKGQARARFKQAIKQDPEEKLILESNPLDWTVMDVVKFIKLTDCAPLAKIFQEQDIDGQALLLLTLPTVQECMELKLGPAIKLCHQIERVKKAFYAQYAN